MKEQHETPQENADETAGTQAHSAEHYLAPRVRAMFNSERPNGREDRMRFDSINSIFSSTAHWAVQNFGDSDQTWKIVEHLLVARGYAHAASLESDREVFQKLADEQSSVLYNLKDFLEAHKLDVWAKIGDPEGFELLSEEEGGVHNLKSIVRNQVIMMDRAKVIMDEHGYTDQWNTICAPVNRSAA